MSETTEYSAAPPAPQASPAPQAPMPSFWEDAIDIFVSPVGVFRRRADDSFWKPFLFVVLVFSVISIATFDSTMQPIMEAEFSRRMAASTQKLNADQVASAMNFTLKFARFFIPVGAAFGMVV